MSLLPELGLTDAWWLQGCRAYGAARRVGGFEPGSGNGRRFLGHGCQGAADAGQPRLPYNTIFQEQLVQPVIVLSAPLMG